MNLFNLFPKRTSLFKSFIFMWAMIFLIGVNGQGLQSAQAKAISDSDIILVPTVMLSGTVRDANTALPIEHAKVEVNTGLYTYTDLSGAYNLSLDQGTYTVTASASYYASQTVADVFVEEAVVLDFNLVHLPVTLTGVVEDSYNRLPLPGAKVELDTGQYTYANSQGIYSFSLPPGVYDVTASMSDYVTQTIYDVTLVAEQVILDIFLVHYPLPVTLTGIVTDAYFLTGIQGAEVLLHTGASYTTGPSGRYSFMLDAGTYTITVSAEGFISQTIESVDVLLGTLVVDFALVPAVCPAVTIESVEIEKNCLEVSFIPDISPLLSITTMWDFGDGTTSTEWAPTHIYDAYGTYPVTLDVVNVCGETDAWFDDVRVTSSSLKSFLPMTVKY